MPIIRIPGMIDPHTHLRDLDWAHKATFQSETSAAIAGGYTAVFDMPNTAPSTTSATLLEEKLARID
ncbi:MAG: amidohydrolase family protein, partial [Chloroflexi bacterium]|nr:amidohydrolase family protein [Chloroflexota bacterium]